MDKKIAWTTNSCVEIINSKRRVKGKLGHEVQILRLPFDLPTNEKFVWLAHTNFLGTVSSKKN